MPYYTSLCLSNGREYCKTQKEANGVDRRKRSLSGEPRHPHVDDPTCDGSALDLSSNCCENEALIRCPAGNATLCSNGNSNGKLQVISKKTKLKNHKMKF